MERKNTLSFHYDLSGLVDEVVEEYQNDPGNQELFARLQNQINGAFIEYGAHVDTIQIAMEEAETYGSKEGLKLLDSMQSDTNAGRAKAMRKVWGQARYKAFLRWTETMVEEYERGGEKIPQLTASGKKNSGMIQAFGILTAWASGAIDDESAAEILSVRIQNGILVSQGKKEKRKKLRVGGKEIIPSSIPIGFIAKLEKWLKDTTE